MPDSIDNIKVINTWLDLYASTGIAVGTALDIFQISGGIVQVHYGATAPTKDEEGYRTLNGAGDSLQGGKDATGAWAYSSLGALINIRPFEDSSTSKGDTSGRAIISVSQTGNQLTFTHADGAKHSIQIAQGAPQHGMSGITAQIASLEQKMQQQGVDVAALKASGSEIAHRLDSLQSVYSYKGKGGDIAYPSSSKGAYVVDLYNSGKDNIPISLPSGAADGTVFVLNNQNSTGLVTLRPATGESIGNGDHIDIQPLAFSDLVKDGTNWHVLKQGYIPSGIADLTHRVAQSLADELHTRAQIIEILNQWLAAPTTQGTLDGILKKLGYTKAGGAKPASFMVHWGVEKTKTWPTDFSGEGVAVGGHELIVPNTGNNDMYHLWFAVPLEHNNDVAGVEADGGMPAIWDSRPLTVEGKQYQVYLSPYPMPMRTTRFSIKWII